MITCHVQIIDVWPRRHEEGMEEGETPLVSCHVKHYGGGGWQEKVRLKRSVDGASNVG